MATQIMTTRRASGSRRRPGSAREDGMPRRGEPADAPPVHLTRRGRVVLLALLIVVLFGAFSLGRAAPQAASSAEPTVALQQITVQPGDSLWTLARRIAPDNDPREVVVQLRRLNDLTTWQLQAGQQLLLPVAT